MPGIRRSAIPAGGSTSTRTPTAPARPGPHEAAAAPLDAIRATQKSRILRAALSAEVIDSYARLKLRQWDAYCAAISPWEREQTLDC